MSGFAIRVGKDLNANINKHILPALGAVALTEIDKFQCPIFLNSVAEEGFSFTVVDHCRTMLKAILEEALDADRSAKAQPASW